MLCGCLLAEFQAGVLSSHKPVVTEQFTQVKGDSGREGEGFAAREVSFCKSLNETSPHEWAGLDFVTLMYPPCLPLNQPIRFLIRSFHSYSAFQQIVTQHLLSFAQKSSVFLENRKSLETSFTKACCPSECISPHVL